MLFTVPTLFTIEKIGCFFDRTFSSDFDYNGEQHNFIEMVYLVDGNAEVVEDEKVYKLKEGDLILHAPMEFHRIKSAGGTSPRVLNLSFSVNGSLPEHLYDGVFSLSGTQRAALLQLNALGMQFCARLGFQTTQADLSHHMVCMGQQISSSLTALLLQISRETPLTNVLSNDRSALLYKQLVSCMEESLCRNLAVEDLAAQYYISVSYVKKLFQLYANMGPRQFYNNMRTKEAAMRLTSGFSAAEVAEQMNFSSPNYFTLFFKKQTGMTPSAYKKQFFSIGISS